MTKRAVSFTELAKLLYIRWYYQRNGCQMDLTCKSNGGDNDNGMF